VRRPDLGVAGETQIGVAHVIGNDEDEVRLALAAARRHRDEERDQDDEYLARHGDLRGSKL
jgi:hypothetical protein